MSTRDAKRLRGRLRFAHGRRPAVLVCMMVVSLAAVAPAAARIRATNPRLVMLEGYWEADPAAAAPDDSVRMRLSLATSTDGTAIRSFAVTSMRAYLDADSSVEPFRRGVGIRPAIILRGRAEAVSRMIEAPAGKAMTIIASWTEGTAGLLVSDVRFRDEAPTSAPEPGAK